MSYCVFYESSRLAEPNHLGLLILHLFLQVKEYVVELLAGVLGFGFSSQHPPRYGRGRVRVFIIMDMDVR